MMKKSGILLIILALLMNIVFAYSEDNQLTQDEQEWISNLMKDLNYADCNLFSNYHGFISRREYAYLAVKAFEAISGIECQVGDAQFDDTDDEWVLKAKNHDLIRGYGNGKFGPDFHIKNEEVAMVYLNVLKASKAVYVLDNNLRILIGGVMSPWASEAISFMYSYRLFKSADFGFYPDNSLTIGEALIMQAKMLDHFQGKGNISDKVAYYTGLDKESTVDQIHMRKTEDDYLYISTRNDTIYVEILSHSNAGKYFEVSLRDGDYEIKETLKAKDWGAASTYISTDGLETNRTYDLDIYVYSEGEEAQTSNWIRGARIKKEYSNTYLNLSPVYYINSDRYNPHLYIEGEYLNNSNLVQAEDHELINLSNEIIKDVTTDYDKIKVIHDWVVNNIYYTYEASTENPDMIDLSATGVLKSRIGSGQGYANLMAALLRAQGIPCKVVMGRITDNLWTQEEAFSEDINHAWNEVYIDGKWIIIDSSWNSNNIYEDGEFKTKGMTSIEFFDTTIEWFSFTHKIISNE